LALSRACFDLCVHSCVRLFIPPHCCDVGATSEQRFSCLPNSCQSALSDGGDAAESCSTCCLLHPDRRPSLSPIASLSTISSSFDSLFRVLCIFPSRYLFAIGFPPVFSLRWSIPPRSGCTLKQPDSLTASLVEQTCSLADPYGTFTLSGAPFLATWSLPWLSALGRVSRLQLPKTCAFGISGLGFSLFTRRYWGNHCCFLFLRLLRCFNSAGCLARVDVTVCG